MVWLQISGKLGHICAVISNKNTKYDLNNVLASVKMSTLVLDCGD